MRTGIFTCLSLLVLAAGYVVYPFYSAWALREAIREGDARYLEQRIQWSSVRESLRASMTEFAVGPTATSNTLPLPSFWQRVKSAVGRSAVNNMVTRYVTPHGLGQLFMARQLYRTHISGDPYADLPLGTRIVKFWNRLKRAEFQSPTDFEIEILDKYDPARCYIGKLELHGLTWRLMELRVRRVGDA